MPLTDIAIRKTKYGTKPFKLTDGGGLHLLVASTGAKLWRLAYRFGGKQKTLALGAYPSVTLADARSARDAARKLLSVGSDPSVQRKLDKQSATITFRLIGEELIEKLKREGRAPRTLAKTRWLLDFAFAAFGDRPISHIAAPEILLALRRVEARGKYVAWATTLVPSDFFWTSGCLRPHSASSGTPPSSHHTQIASTR